MSAFKKLVPEPLLSVCLTALWLLLARSTSPGQVVLAVALAVAVPLVTARLRPLPLRARRPLVIARFLATVGRDVLASNFEIARGVLAASRNPPRSRFVVIPLALESPLGLAVLAMVVTVVPGTVWSELALDRSALLLHVWDVVDEEQFVTRFKARYETPLKEIFA
jgi:multicomponent K+:H+ antiporter subunit E